MRAGTRARLEHPARRKPAPRSRRPGPQNPKAPPQDTRRTHIPRAAPRPPRPHRQHQPGHHDSASMPHTPGNTPRQRKRAPAAPFQPARPGAGPPPPNVRPKSETRPHQNVKTSRVRRQGLEPRSCGLSLLTGVVALAWVEDSHGQSELSRLPGHLRIECVPKLAADSDKGECLERGRAHTAPSGTALFGTTAATPPYPGQAAGRARQALALVRDRPLASRMVTRS
jgi:hypothetical protein